MILSLDDLPVLEAIVTQLKNQIVNELVLAAGEKFAENLDEWSEDLIDEFLLHLWRELLIEWELFHN